jgi:hypothetical protein
MTRVYDAHWSMRHVASDRKRVAADGVYNGVVDDPGMRTYLERCRAYHRPTGTVLSYRRDVGAPTAGGLTPPEYESCAHLSLWYGNPTTGQSRPHDHGLSRLWAEAFFHEHCRWLWVEPPGSAEGKRREVYHYRLLVDMFGIPLLPRTEGYRRDVTEAGWKSWSELYADHPPVEPPLVRRD